jgi:hypothetical protein
MEQQQLIEIATDHLEDLLRNDPLEVPRLFPLQLHLLSPEVSVVTGVRRCGKSTVLRQVAAYAASKYSIHYLNFEDQRLIRFEVDDFRRAYEEFLIGASPDKKHLLIYDEIQLVKGWERWLAGLSSKKHIKVFISGSNSQLLSSELATLLTGRHKTLHITPFSFREIVNTLPEFVDDNGATVQTTAHRVAIQRALKNFMNYGGFPRAYLGKDLAIISQYHEDILFKDIAVRRRVKNVSALRKLSSILATQNTRLFNQNKSAVDVGIKSDLTIAKFCDYFTEVYLYSELRLYSRSRRKQLRGKAKFYAVDPLLAKSVGYHHGDTTYWILENHVANELHRRGYEVHYWHSKNGYEVDFIAYKKGEESLALQVAVSLGDPRTVKREVRALESARAELGVKKTYIVTLEEISPDTLNELAEIQVISFPKWACF